MKRKIEPATIARTVILVLALVNQFLTMQGKNPLPFAEDNVYELVTTIITIAASIWAWWKNNSFTQAAMEADGYMKGLKEGGSK